MSGTSADGVDVALVRVTNSSTALLHHHHEPYDAALGKAIFRLRESGTCSLKELAQLARDISLAYAAAVNETLRATATRPAAVAAVAAHGQTLFHDPPCTIQWLDPALLAAATGCAVVSDFRRADCAANGQGAPLVPFADFKLFGHSNDSRVLLNLGGIANLTSLPAGCSLSDLTAFDTGPANCISDAIVRRHFPDHPGHDPDGRLAGRGRCIEPLLIAALGDPYFHKPPPKSTDGPAMISLFDSAAESTGPAHSPFDLLCTAIHLSAITIANAVRTFAPFELIASGGGIHNRTLMSRLTQLLPGVTLRTTDDLGIPSAAKEAIAFALLAAETLDGRPSNVPSCTGASRAVVLGSITPRP